MKNLFFPLFSPDAGAAGGGGGAPAGAGAVAAGAPPAGAAGGAPAGGAGGAPAGGAPGGGAAPAPYYADLIGKDGALNHSAFERLPDNLKPLAPSLANVKTVDDLFAKLSNLNTAVGKKALAPLPANATQEDRDAQAAILRAVNGVPEKPEGYAFKRPDALPEAAWDDKYAGEIQGILHKHNASPALAAELLAAQTKQVGGNIQAQLQYEKDFYAQQDQEFRASLQKDGLDYDKTMNLITRAAAQFGMPADAPMLKNAGVRSMMLKVAQAIGEAKFIGGEGGAQGTKSDRATAEAIMHDKSNPDYLAYWANVNGNPDHPKAGEVRKRVNDLLSAAAIAEKQAQAGGKR